MGMEIFLIASVTAMLVVIVMDTKHKRQAFLCQQDEPAKRHR
jgi:hypothetical protein